MIGDGDAVKRQVLQLAALLLASSALVRAVDVTGNWQVTISTSVEKLTGKASLKQTGHNVNRLAWT